MGARSLKTVCSDKSVEIELTGRHEMRVDCEPSGSEGIGSSNLNRLNSQEETVKKKWFGQIKKLKYLN